MSKILSLGIKKKKQAFLLFFARLFVPLRTCLESTFARNKKEKTSFSFVLRSLIRTFVNNFLKHEHNQEA